MPSTEFSPNHAVTAKPCGNCQTIAASAKHAASAHPANRVHGAEENRRFPRHCDSFRWGQNGRIGYTGVGCRVAGTYKGTNEGLQIQRQCLPSCLLGTESTCSPSSSRMFTRFFFLLLFFFSSYFLLTLRVWPVCDQCYFQGEEESRRIFLNFVFFFPPETSVTPNGSKVVCFFF